MAQIRWTAAVVTLTWAGAALAQSIPAGAKYVALGSSYASGAGITQSADTPPNRCDRSRDNYAHQIAREHRLKLVDVSCSGAVIDNLLHAWDELPPQIDALDAETRLVTVTVGGNDVGYAARLNGEACRNLNKPGVRCAVVPPLPAAKDWAGLEANFHRLVEAVHKRAPDARLVFVDYPQVLPAKGTCPALSLTIAQAEQSRAIDQRVVEITLKVARATGSDVIDASALTAGHDACAAIPWSNGYPPPQGGPFHPRLEDHTAIARAIDRLLWP